MTAEMQNWLGEARWTIVEGTFPDFVSQSPTTFSIVTFCSIHHLKIATNNDHSFRNLGSIKAETECLNWRHLSVLNVLNAALDNGIFL